MPQNETIEIINVDAESDGGKNQEDQYENPVDTLSQNQDNVPNTTTTSVITAVDDTSDEHTAGGNPNGAVQVEDVEEDNDGDDASDNKYDGNITKGVDNRYPRRNKKKRDSYEPSFRGHQYSYQHNPMFIQTQGYNAMSENDKDKFILGIIMTQYSLKRGLKELGARGVNTVKKELSQLHNMHTFITQDPRVIPR